MADIFISYKKEENDIARQFARVFEAEGWTVWWDARIQAGDDFDETIRQELKNAKIVVVLWSQQSVESDYIKGEARNSKDQGKLISVFIDDVSEQELPFDLQNIQGERIQDPNDKSEFKKLLNDITARIGVAKTERERELESKLEKALYALDEQKKHSSKSGVRELFPWALSFLLAISGIYLLFSTPVPDDTESELGAELAKWQTKADKAAAQNRADSQIIQQLTEKVSETERVKKDNEELKSEVENWRSGAYEIAGNNQEDLVSAQTLKRKEAELAEAEKAKSVLEAQIIEMRTTAEQAAAQIQSDHQTILALKNKVAETESIKKTNDELMAEVEKWESGVYAAAETNQEDLVSAETLTRKEVELAELKLAKSALEADIKEWRTRAQTAVTQNQSYYQAIKQLEGNVADAESIKQTNEELKTELDKWRAGEYKVAGQVSEDLVGVELLNQKVAELEEVKKANVSLEARVVDLRSAGEKAAAQNESDRQTIDQLNKKLSEFDRIRQANEELKSELAKPRAANGNKGHVLIGIWKGELVVGLNNRLQTRMEIEEFDSEKLSGHVWIEGSANGCKNSKTSLTPRSGDTYLVTFSGGCNARGKIRHKNGSLLGTVSFVFTNDTAKVNLEKSE